MDLDDARRKLEALAAGALPLDRELKPVGIIPVHVGGLMMDMDAVRAFAERAWSVGRGRRRPCLSGRLSQRARTGPGGAAARTPRPSPVSPSMPTRP